jgi:DNA-binding NtrC family response regulator
VGDPTGGNTLSISDGRRARGAGAVPRPHLFLALESYRPMAPPARFALAELEEIVIGRGTARSAQRATDNPQRLLVRVPDPWMSSTHAQLTKVLGRWVLEDANSKNGTIVNGASQKRAFLADGDVIELGHTFFLYRDAIPTVADDPPQVDAARLAPPAPTLATLLPPLMRSFDKLAQIASSPVSVVIGGESGTGKEVVARAVHHLSQRSGEFVAVNCGALPDNLIESELFGHRKGAFTGAVDDRLGLVRTADRGTLFLDEIGDLPPASQAAFLRVLQEREVVPVGAARPLPVDIRLIAATHRDLGSLVEKGTFRADLYARISGFKLDLPPLRQRREDLGLLIAALLRRLFPDRLERIGFDVEAARALFRHSWPMNIRELEKTLQTAVVLAGDLPVATEHLPDALRSALDDEAPETSEELANDSAPLSADDAKRREELVALLAEHGGNISQVARVMGKARMQIQRWVKRFGLDPESYRK